ncbi:MAG TPA: NAD(P)-dependent oxidoreductase [Gammaproteobacteria bacterium]|nr:NAD(P)-dependent oxidoreductase [Gammaproteobacteria bacterium]
MHKIGIVGTGYIASGIYEQIKDEAEIKVSKILTRRPLDSSIGLPLSILTHSAEAMIEDCDLIVEASGDAIYATEVLLKAQQAGKPIITMNPEFQITTGSYFVDKGYITDADGDQPGCLARLKQEVEGLNFKPLAYLNIKGFLNLLPPEDEMRYWAERQKLSLEQTISFTDGSKVQIEQALVANGLNADIAQDGMLGPKIENMADTGFLADTAKEMGQPISDYILCANAPPGVLIIAEHALAHERRGNVALNKLLTSDGKYFRLLMPHHLIFLEVIKTIRDWISGAPPLLNNSPTPRIGVCALAKKPLHKGDTIERGLGSFETRGSTVRIQEHPDHVPICLLQQARLLNDIAPGQPVNFSDVELPESKALEIYLQIREKVLNQ